MSRVFVPVTGSVVFSWQMNRSGVRMESSQHRVKAINPISVKVNILVNFS